MQDVNILRDESKSPNEINKNLMTETEKSPSPIKRKAKSKKKRPDPVGPERDYSKNFFNDPYYASTRIAILLALALLGIGIWRKEYMAVFHKAIRICFECIGLS